MPDSSAEHLTKSRRDFLKIAGAGAAAAALIGASRLAAPHVENLLGNLDTIPPGIKNDYIDLNGVEIDMSMRSLGLGWAPDGHVPYLTFPDGNRTTFISAGSTTYRFDDKQGEYEPLFVKFMDSSPDKFKKHEVAFGPDKNIQYRNGYSGITTLFQSNPNSNTVYALTHNEQWQDGNPANFTASVGLLESRDKGKTWQDKGPIIEGQDKLEPGEKVTGAGQPCGIVREVDGKKYLYTYYVDWSSQKHVQAPDQIYLSRMELGNSGVKKVEHFTKDGFKEDIKQVEKTPVISPPNNIHDSSYAAIPDISFNTYLNKYLAVFETNVGFCITQSDDATTWENPQIFFKFLQTQANRKRGDTWYSYPTLVSETTQSTDQITSKEGNIVYSKGKWLESAHQPKTAAFTLK